MVNKKDDKKTVNVKFDAETKSKLEALAFLRGEKLQALCENIIKECLDANADAIASAEKLKKQFKK